MIIEKDNPKSWDRGNKIIFSYKTQSWYYIDTMKIVNHRRACIRCGQRPTKEGHDACLGYIPGVESACCGHGRHTPIMIKE